MVPVVIFKVAPQVFDTNVLSNPKEAEPKLLSGKIPEEGSVGASVIHSAEVN